MRKISGGEHVHVKYIFKITAEKTSCFFCIDEFLLEDGVKILDSSDFNLFVLC